MENFSYVYRHRRLDTFEIFYVGIGTIYPEHRNSISLKRVFRRAYLKNRRTDFWKRIVNKHGYIVEIIQTNLTEEEAKELEILLISEYGRLDLGLGNLINMTDGGDGTLGYLISDLQKESIRKSLKGKVEKENNGFYGKKHTIESKNIMKNNHADFSLGKHPKSRKVINILTGEVINSIKELVPITNLHYTTLIKKLNGKLNNNTNYKFL